MLLLGRKGSGYFKKLKVYDKEIIEYLELKGALIELARFKNRGRNRDELHPGLQSFSGANASMPCMTLQGKRTI